MYSIFFETIPQYVRWNGCGVGYVLRRYVYCILGVEDTKYGQIIFHAPWCSADLCGLLNIHGLCGEFDLLILSVTNLER